MALWGNKDDKTSTGTVTIVANGNVTGSSTKFQTESKVGDYIKANNKEHRIISITSNTACKVVAGTLGATITAVGAGNNYTISEKPISVSASEVGADANNVFGVDTTEAGVTQGAGHAGWVRRVTKTDMHGTDRTQHEVLCAMSSISGDAADDTEFADS